MSRTLITALVIFAIAGSVLALRLSGATPALDAPAQWLGSLVSGGSCAYDKPEPRAAAASYAAERRTDCAANKAAMAAQSGCDSQAQAVQASLVAADRVDTKAETCPMMASKQDCDMAAKAESCPMSADAVAGEQKTGAEVAALAAPVVNVEVTATAEIKSAEVCPDGHVCDPAAKAAKADQASLSSADCPASKDCPEGACEKETKAVAAAQ